MIRDITLGQYFPGSSYVHRLDPRVKILATMLYIVSLFVVDDFIGLRSCSSDSEIARAAELHTEGSEAGIHNNTVHIRHKSVHDTGRGAGVLLDIHHNAEGLRTAVFMAVRLILLIIGSSLLTLTTRPISLTDGIEALLSPFKRFGLPAHELAMMMTIALRFIPTLLEETDKIMKAQQARGADFESGNILRRAKALVPILVPLFISAFRIAQDLAMAMEARCYGSGMRGRG